MWLDDVYKKVSGDKGEHKINNTTDSFSLLGLLPLGTSNYDDYEREHKKDIPVYSNPVAKLCDSAIQKYPVVNLIIYKKTDVDDNIKFIELVATMKDGIS
ncbi:hypothetical protein GQ473_04050 [archaeon]|nr:hypothetical protein [archaeon]